MKKTYLSASLILALIALLFIGACKKKATEQAPSDSFLPMQVGNLWYLNDGSYTEIKDKVMINNKPYFQFYSLIGGDAISISYLRIDEKNRLIESYPDAPLKIFLRADFNASVGDKFFTTGDKDYNDNEVTVIQKSDTEMTFSFDAVYHPNLKGHPHPVKYIKGKGFPGNWKKVVINGVVYQN
ncbi:hypothetical protein OC25_11685 [Pedobacter kyungheensis]|uniref:Lipoprotein n=1 Tax=Pedobacter kyungheensis TaxID=1069985 RepID=A0A0C1G0U8_9SPHI|nr:hypothetical protein [Pedobacter kyungheensis]KIA93704.1 hypothetical protein OC25_11685 [Pedobacter kyungheensis]